MLIMQSRSDESGKILDGQILFSLRDEEKTK